MRCKNSGSDYDENSIQWTCTASLPEEFKLGSTDVICEGYDYPEDPYILKGSCGVEYRLILTDKGRERYGKGRGGWQDDDEDRPDGPKTMGEKIAGALFWMRFRRHRTSDQTCPEPIAVPSKPEEKPRFADQPHELTGDHGTYPI